MVKWFARLVIILGIVANLSELYRIPLIIDGDASHQALAAGQAISERLPFFGCCFKGEMSNAYLYFLGSWLTLFPGLFGLRLFSFVWGVLGAGAVYLLAQKLTNRPTIPLYAAVTYLTLPFSQYFFRSGLEITLIMLLLLLSLYLFITAWESKKTIILLAPSLLIGLGLYLGPQIKFWPVLVVITWFLLISHRKVALTLVGIIKFWFITSVMFALSVIIYLPALVSSGSKQPLVGNRVNQVLDTASARTAATIASDTVKSTVVFFYPIGPSGLFFIRSPYLNQIHSALLVLGWLYLLVVNRRTALYLSSWYLLGAFVAGGLTLGSPTSSRMIINLPVAVLCIANGVSLVEHFLQLLVKKRHIITVGLVSFLMLYGYQVTNHYFQVELTNYANQYDYLASTVGRFLADGKFTNKQIYLLSNSNYYFHAIMSLRLLTGQAGIDVPEEEQPILASQIQQTKGNIVIVPYWYANFLNEVETNPANGLTTSKLIRVDGLPSSYLLIN